MSLIARAGIRTIVATIAIGVVLFVAAGDLAWWPAWAYMAVLVVSTIVPLVGPFRLDEGLIEERMSRKKLGAKAWDQYFVGLVGVFTIAELVVPGLDHRWGWTNPQPVWENLLGLALVILGTSGLTWAMRVNRFFSAVIRIQEDRGHHVVSEGPYRFVRHPGYAFWSLRTLGVPLLFGSNWAFIVAGLFVSMFVVRTVLEDRVLKKELVGYSEYVDRVRSKLVMGVW
ncbi:MAG TPA: isoprenylcysteine carboxylmethyltransferase family protein [Acidobacteriota bacterium]|nr:isoprenylcysteine carboxylmethyltransferase family protein [Acidobacteriota bacterium]